MPTILVQNTDATLKKFFDIVSEKRYKIFTDMTMKKIDDIFRFLENDEEIMPDVKTPSEIRASLPTGEAVALKGDLGASDAAKWAIRSVAFSSPDGTTVQMTGSLYTKLKGTSDYLALGATSDSPTHYLVYDSATGKLGHDADGSDVKSELVDIAMIGNKVAVTTADIVIV